MGDLPVIRYGHHSHGTVPDIAIDIAVDIGMIDAIPNECSALSQQVQL